MLWTLHKCLHCYIFINIVSLSLVFALYISNQALFCILLIQFPPEMYGRMAKCHFPKNHYSAE